MNTQPRDLVDSMSLESALPAPEQSASIQSKQKVLVAGLARNCGKSIHADVARIANALKNFKQVAWLIVESDSFDDTVAKLNELRRHIANFNVIALGTLRERLPLRTERISYCRNQYLDELHRNPAYTDVDLLIVADLDGINVELTEQAVNSCWKHTDWGVCTANQRGPYYDIFALRHQLWCPHDPFREQQFFAGLVGHEKAMSISFQSRMLRIPADSEWLEVESAFGGFAVYKRAAIRNARYQGLDDQGREVCEHVSFHRAIRADGFRIFINPALLNAGFTEHSSRYRWLPTAKRNILNAIKRCLGRPAQ